jgi:transcriptional regulator with XRE-family HTH domain
MLYIQVKHALRPSPHYLSVESETIHDRIRRRRLELGLSVQEVAKACGVSRQAANAWESAATKAPSGPNLVAAAVALKVNEQWLATGKEPKERAEPLGTDELELLAKYRRLTPRDKGTVKSLAQSLIPLAVPFTGTM